MAKAVAAAQRGAGKPAKRRARRRPRGALAAISALLVASAMIRVATGAGEALAREGGDSLKPEAAVKAGHLPEAALPRSKPGSDPVVETRLVAEADIQPLLTALNAREARLRKREAALDVRMQALSVAETEIDRKMTALGEAESSLRQTLALARTAAEDDIENLTTVYANMKPKQAAALFEEMDPEFSAGFLARMRPDAAAAIMAGMTPQAAYLVSVILAGRNANVPKN